MKKIFNFLKFVGNLVLTIWILSLILSLFFGIFTKYSIANFFGLLIGGFLLFGVSISIIDFFSSFGKQTNNGDNYSGKNDKGSYHNNNGYAPYQGDKSMVGGVVGGSATPPVGGRAGQ